MAISKIERKTESGVETIIDLTSDTVTPETLAEGATAHDASGNQIVGTMRSGEDLEAVLAEQAGLIDTLQETLKHKASGGDFTDDRELYQRVEYIESAEEKTYPYIITDFVADNSCGLEVIASFSAMADRIPMGSSLDTDATRFYCVYPLSTSTVYYGFNTGTSYSCSLALNTIYRLQTNFLNSRLTCIYEEDGTRKLTQSINQTLVQQTVPVAIFGYNSASSDAVLSKR